MTLGAPHVPGPDPELIDATKHLQSPQTIAFRPLGQYASQVYYSHCRIPIQIKQVKQAFKEATNILINTGHTYQVSNKQATDKIVKSGISILETEYSLFQDSIALLPNTAPNTTPNSKHRRFIFDYVISSAALVLATSATIQVSKLEQQVNANKDVQDQLIKIEHLHEDHLKHIDDRLKIQEHLIADLIYFNPGHLAAISNAITHNISTAAHIIKDVVQSALSRKLSPGALTTGAMEAILHHAKDIAKHGQFINLVEKTADIHSLEVSSLYYPEKEELVLWLHIPFVAKQHLMKMHQFVPLPLIHDFGRNYSLVPNVGHEDILAIAHTNYYKVLSASDLQSCQNLRDTFFCTGRRVLQTDLKNSCLGALYLGSGEHVKNNCNFLITKAKEQIYEIGKNEWAVYSTGTISTNEFCNDGSIKPKQIRSGDHVKVQPGCQIRTMQHLIYTENEDEFALQPLVFKWNWDAEKLFPDHGSQVVQELIASMDPKDGRSYDATNLLQRLDVLKTHADSVANSHWFFSTPVLMIVGTIILMVIIYLIYRYRCAKPTPEIYQPPSPVNPTFQATAPPSVVAPPSTSAQQVFVKYVT